MKHRYAALAATVAAWTAAPPATAQNVTAYGIVDLAAEQLDNVAPGGGRLRRMPGLTGTVSSRLGFRGSEDLGGGLKANFTLEMGIGADAGTLNQGGRGWGRQAFVGLSGDWGAVTVGRQYTMLFWASLDADVLGPNAYGTGSLDSYFPNARFDNALAYRATFAGLQVGAAYSLGRDGVNAGPSPAGTNCGGENVADKKACIGQSFMLKYDTPTWGAALATDTLRGGAGAFGGLTSSDKQDTRWLLNGYVKFGGTKLGGGYVKRSNDGSPATPKSDLVYLGVQYALTPQATVEAEWVQLKFKGSANQAALLALRASYAFSRRTTVYATMGYIDNSGTLAFSASGAQAGGAPAAGASQTGVASGIRHAF